MNNNIVDALHVALPNFPETCDPHADRVTVLTFRIRCLPSREAIRNVAAKYRKGLTPLETRAHQSNNAPLPQTPASTATETYREMVEAGEHADAVAFRSLRHTVYFGRTENGPAPLVSATLLRDDPRFVVSRSTGNLDKWSVTHLGTGLAAVQLCRTGKEAVDALRRLDQAKLEASIAARPGDYQQQARDYYEGNDD